MAHGISGKTFTLVQRILLAVVLVVAANSMLMTIAMVLQVLGIAKLEGVRWSQGVRKSTIKVLWDGRDNEGRSVSTGVYLVHLLSHGYREMSKVTLIK